MTDAQERPPRVHAVLAVHNRIAATTACLDALRAQTADAELVPYVFDDGSTDGTGAAVAQGYPEAVLLAGDGTFFWNGGMRVAIAAAMAGRPDHLLWVNDDTTLAPEALATLLATRRGVSARSGRPAVVVGAVRDPATGALDYSGVVQQRGRRLRFDMVEPGEEPRRADSMHGNCVLVPRAVYEVVGNLDPGYGHAMGDYDYGLRVTRAGFEVWVAPGTLATCPSNPGYVVAGDLGSDWRRLLGVKGLPPAEWARFARRWGGRAWPVFWASPYLRRMARSAAASARRASGAGRALGDDRVG